MSGLSSCQGVDVADIQVQITTLARIALIDLRRARENGDMALIREAQQRFDYYCDKLPRSSTAQENQ